MQQKIRRENALDYHSELCSSSNYRLLNPTLT